MAVEVEDDVFFADLSKQIAMLIMDDEEELPVQSPPLPVQMELLREVPSMHRITMLQPYITEISYKRESKGTGVFIPKSTAPKRKSRSKRSTSVVDNSSSQRQPHKSATGIANPKHFNSSSVLKRHAGEGNNLSISSC